MRHIYSSAAGRGQVSGGDFRFPPRDTGLLQGPPVSGGSLAVTMCRKKAPAMPPEPGPDPFKIRLWQAQLVKCRAGKKLKPPFAMSRRQRVQPFFHLEQKHQPVALPQVTLFTDEDSEMQIRGGDAESELFAGLSTGATVR